MLLKAFRKVRSVFPRVTLTVVGCRPFMSEPGVECVGKVPTEQICGFHARASVFCMPSQREPFGIVYLEAMHSGLPVVALRQGAPPDFITDGENGFLVDPDDEELLAKRLIHLLSNPELCREMGLDVPGDLSVVGFDNVPDSRCVDPPLTTVDQSIEAMGKLAAQIVLKLIQGQPWEAQMNKVPTELVIRRSCRAIVLES